VVRKWVRRFQEEGEEGLKDCSRKPHHSPRQTPPEIEKQVRQARKATRYGRERLALYLQRGGLNISPHTIRHILRKHHLPRYQWTAQDENDTLALAARWVYFYNVQRPHLGEGMDKQTPLEVLQRLGYNGPDQIALIPPTLTDP
jgi:hypothetical protein